MAARGGSGSAELSLYRWGEGVTMSGLRHLPNAICIARIALVWPTVKAIENGQNTLALILFTIAAVSDGLDGFLAKRFGWTSDLGRFLDPLADKLLLVSVFLALTWAGWVPEWLAVAVIARDLMIGGGSLIFRLWFGPLRGYPTLVSKFNTALQITVLISALLQAIGGWVPPVFFDALVMLTFFTTLGSGLDYFSRFFVRAWRATADRAV
jgi:cardiolipin synthase